MKRKRLLWQLYFSYLIITISSLIAALVFSFWAIRNFYFEQTRLDLEARALLIVPQVQPYFSATVKALDLFCHDLGQKGQTRISLILPSGKVICDSRENHAQMDNHADRPEVMTAYSGRTGSQIRYSNTLKKDMLYVALPIVDGDNIVGVVRTAMPLASLGLVLYAVQGRILFGGMIIALLAMAISLFISRRISRPLEEMKQGAQRFARGELESRLSVPETEELAELALTMNHMAAQLHERIMTITQHHNEQQAIFSSMVEGVIAVDSQARIISINQAACHLLAIKESKAKGSSIQEVVRNRSLHNLVGQVLDQEKKEITEYLLEINGRFLQAHGEILRDLQGAGIGAVLVLNDVTRLRQLEDLRREFVANVSHELKTPITSIKGFVETLRDGALQVPADAERFLNIISKQVDRLNAIIDDLLLLAGIEQKQERREISLEEEKIHDVLSAAIEVCSVQAAKKDICLGLNCDGTLYANINSPLLVQAVCNLITNAVNFSPPSSKIWVKAFQDEAGVAIQVQDQGCGIDEEHLLHLFERFYRVDQARSRKLGGTGLGLAIVKHIAQVHGGEATVSSRPDEGSTFSIFLPGPNTPQN